MSKKVITLQNDIEAEGVSAKAGNKVLLKNLLNKDSLREEIKHILGHCPAKSHICWFSKTNDKLKKDFPNDDDTRERAMCHLQEKAIETVLTSHIEEAERKYTYTGVKDKHGTEIKAGDVLKDDWQGFLYKVSFKNGSFILQSTGNRINEKGEKVKDWIGEGRTSQIYDNIKDFSGRHEIFKSKQENK